MHRVKAVAPQAKANRVEYRRDGITEWYENGPLGLEQGFTLAHRPGKANGQPLTLELALRGDLLTALETGGRGLELRDKDGKAVLRYTGLIARDANGRELRSWLQVRGERLLVRVEDEGARYPVVVDPWIQNELTASDGAAGDQLGLSIAVGGSTLVVGAPFRTVWSNAQQGAAYVFGQSGGKWVQQAELTDDVGGYAGEWFGAAVATNSNGSTIVVGAPCNPSVDCGPGKAFLYNSSGGATLQAPSGGQGFDFFGFSVAVNDDGGTIVVGAPAHPASGPGPGAAYVFNADGSPQGNSGTWLLRESGGSAGDYFGASVAVAGVTGNGNSVAVGVPNAGTATGIVVRFFYDCAPGGCVWNQQGGAASDGAQGDAFGASIAMNNSTLVVGAPGHNSYQGAAYVFNTQSSGTGVELTASDGGGSFGNSVAVSGNTVAVGAPVHGVGSNVQQGAAYVFVNSGGTWSQQSELTASDGAAFDLLGTSVGVSGSTVVAGSPQHTVVSNTQQGAAYGFAYTGVTLSPTLLSFGNEAIDNTSAVKTVMLKNTGTATLDISNIAASANFAVSSTTCGATLAVGKTCKVSVTFTPTQARRRMGDRQCSDLADRATLPVELQFQRRLRWHRRVLSPSRRDWQSLRGNQPPQCRH